MPFDADWIRHISVEGIPVNLAPEAWMNQGYRKFSQKLKLADFILQKVVSDEIGKRYYITVYVYDWLKYPTNIHRGKRWGYMADVQFCFEDGSFTNVEYSSFTSIEQVEKHFDSLWNFFGKVYSEEYDEDE